MTGDSVTNREGHEERKGTRGRRLPAARKVERDLQIVIDRNRGLSWPLIASRHGLKERQARNIYRAWRETEQATVAGRDPLEHVYELIERYETIQGELALIAEQADNDSARVGAYRAQMEAMARQAELMQATGLLPRRLGQLRVEADVRLTAARIVQVFERFSVPEEARRAVVAALEPGP